MQLYKKAAGRANGGNSSGIINQQIGPAKNFQILICSKPF